MWDFSVKDRLVFLTAEMLRQFLVPQDRLTGDEEQVFIDGLKILHCAQCTVIQLKKFKNKTCQRLQSNLLPLCTTVTFLSS